METLITVLITLMVVALIGAGINLVRLNKKAGELDTLKLDLVDVQDYIERQFETTGKDMHDRIDNWISSTDRRFDHQENKINKLEKKK